MTRKKNHRVICGAEGVYGPPFEHKYIALPSRNGPYRISGKCIGMFVGDMEEPAPLQLNDALVAAFMAVHG